MKFLIFLLGCGFGSSSAIEEVIITYAVMDRYKIKAQQVTEDKEYKEVNELIKEYEKEIDLILKSDRQDRKFIKSVEEVDTNEYDALIVIGCEQFKQDYVSFPIIKSLIKKFKNRKKPIATMCSGIDFIRLAIDNNILEDEMNKIGIDEFSYDEKNNIYYTPTFNKGNNIFDMLKGVDKMVHEMIANLKK